MVRQLIRYLETSNISPQAFVISFFASTTLRHTLEAFSQQTYYFNLPNSFLLADIIHFNLSYVVLFLLLTAIIYSITSISIHSLSRILSTSFILLMMTPLVDLMITAGRGFNIQYFLPQNTEHLWLNFFTLGSYSRGISFGLQCEIIVVLMLSYLYFRYKNIAVIRSLVATLSIYTTIFLWAAIPYLLMQVMPNFHYSSQAMIMIYLLILPPLSLLILYFWNRNLTLLYLKDLRYSRLCFYYLVLFMGLSFTSFDWREVIIPFILTLYAILFAAIFIIVTNNVADIAIDRISNPSRPLIKNHNLNAKTYLNVGYFFATLALFYAALISAKTLFILLSIMASYYLYSSPPIRFKRLPILSKLVIGFNALLLIILGYLYGNHSMQHFPTIFFPLYLIGATMIANVIDLKDAEGDLKNGIYTLANVLPLQVAKHIIGLSFLLSYVASYFLVPHLVYLIGAICLGTMQYVLILQMPYRENKILILNNLALVLLILSRFIFH